MTLDEVVYQIEGKLEVVRDINPVMDCEVLLKDKISELTMVVVVKDGLVKETLEARATGVTEEEAKCNLVQLLRGNILRYDVPVMWTSSTVSLRIPPTLVVSDQFPIYSEEHPLVSTAG